MPKFRVSLHRIHTEHESAEVEIEAEDEDAANEQAEIIHAADGNLASWQETSWHCEVEAIEAELIA